jgi:hypothetical protein
MKLRSKLIVSALIAFSVASALAAPSALADRFKAENNPYQLTFGTSIAPVFKTTAGNVSCKIATGTTESISGSETSQLEMEPTFSECTGMGFPTTVDVNGCRLTWHIGIFFSTTGTVDVQCAVGTEMTFTAISAGTKKCTIHVPPQAGLSTVTYKNLGAGATQEVQAEMNLKEVKYSHTAGTGLGSCTTGSAATGELAWTVLLTAENPSPPNSHIGFWVGI